MTTPFGKWEDIPQNGHDFYNNETTKSLKKNARYLATIQKGNTAEWDCSCLIFAILYSDTIGTTLSAAIRKEVDDLRQVRNDISHMNDAELTDADFQNYVARVLVAFTSLKLPLDDLEIVKNQTSFPTAEVKSLKMQAGKLKHDLKTKDEEVKNLNSELQLTQNKLQKKQKEIESLTQEINSTVESFCSLTLKPSHQIIRRLGDVTRITKKLDELQNKNKRAVSTIYLSGILGCGKSQIARQVGQEVFDRRLSEGEGLAFVATLNAETLDSLADSYFCLARHLGITEYALTNLTVSTKGESREKIQDLKRFITPKMKQFSYWLIIIDNVVDLPSVRCYLPSTGSEEWGYGQVLITTQDTWSVPSNAPHTYHESLNQGMDPDDALDLLWKVSQMSNQDQAEKVAEALEYQPLALAAAAVYVQTVVNHGSPNYGWTKYLETFESNEREAREELFVKQNIAYPQTMSSSIKLAVTRVIESDDILREVFVLFSLCASDSIPAEAVVGFVKYRTTEQAEEFIRAKIQKSSLISYVFDEDHTFTYFRVHNVIYEVLKSVTTCGRDLTYITECLSVSITIFHSLIEANKNLLHASGQVCVKLDKITHHCRQLYLFFRTTFAIYTELLDKGLSHLITPGDLVSWLSSTAEVCCLLNKLSDAYFFSKSSSYFLDYLNNEPKDRLLKSDHFHVHGNVYSSIGQYTQAREYHERSLTIRKEIYGEDHEDVAASYNNLGNVYSNLGQYSQAKECYETSLAFFTKKDHGGHHGHVAMGYNNLGNVYSALGQYSQAKEYQEKSLAIRKEIYGEHHGDVATSYNNLGKVHSDLGQYKQAEDYHQKSLAIKKDIYGEHHGDVALSYYNLGNVYSNLGKYCQAQEYYEKCRAIREEIISELHQWSAINRLSVGENPLSVNCDVGQHSHARSSQLH